MQVRSRRGFLAGAAAIAAASSVGACTRRGERGDLLDVSASAELPAAAESLAADGTTIVLGDPGAALAVRLYEDPSCPACEEFETQGTGSYLKRAARNGGLQLQSGSKHAVNALRAALDRGRFAEYHDVLYRHQASARKGGGFTRDGLLALAVLVEGLRGPEFDAAVQETAHRQFVEASDEALGASVKGTPTMAINGTVVPTENQALYTDRSRLYRHLRARTGGEVRGPR
ncbi:thioredoxin domain-containing protein [Streptomyces sp. NPDC005409]|uniref:DsbA family protein n=1 Tax=Streptomyces sp. NPDC005409 TaxID=3155342 RepID=UPI0034541AA5